MHLDFSDKTALVTGASRGIGRRIALDLASCGARLIVTSTRPDGADELLRSLGSHARHFAVDFTDPVSTRTFLAEVRNLPALHVCINNAGTARHGPSDAATDDDWDVTSAVNLKAPFFVSQAAAAIMKRRRYGRIVNVSSIWGHLTMAGRSIYTAAKFGLRGLSLTYAVELARHNVLVNVVSPGFTRTDMLEQNYTAEQLEAVAAKIPLGRLATPDEVSRAVCFLASDLNTYITGQSLVVDGGYSIV